MLSLSDEKAFRSLKAQLEEKMSDLPLLDLATQQDQAWGSQPNTCPFLIL